MNVSSLRSWRIIWLSPSWTCFLDASSIFLKSLTSEVLFCWLRICSCLSLGLFWMFSTSVFWAYSILFLHNHIMNSLVLSLVSWNPLCLVSSLVHSCHDIIVGMFHTQNVIWSLIVNSHSSDHFSQAHRLVWLISCGVGWNIVDYFLHLKDVRRLLETTCCRLVLLSWKKIFLCSWWPVRRHLHLLLIGLSMKILGTRSSSFCNVILLLNWLLICWVLLWRLRLVYSFALICQSHQFWI